MDLQNLVNQLRSERTRIDRAINALEGIGQRPRRGRPSKASQGRHMSAAARERISEAMKRRWAKWKGKSGPKQVKTTSKKSGQRNHMSPAAKKRLSVQMKARWAERKAQGLA
jgi:hypothetical protein